MFKTMRSPWVAVMRHSQRSPSSETVPGGKTGETNDALFSWNVRPHSKWKGIISWFDGKAEEHNGPTWTFIELVCLRDVALTKAYALANLWPRFGLWISLRQNRIQISSLFVQPLLNVSSESFFFFFPWDQTFGKLPLRRYFGRSAWWSRNRRTDRENWPPLMSACWNCTLDLRAK